MKYHHGAIRCVHNERISVQAWGQLDEDGRIVYEYADDGTVHVEIYGTRHGDLELAITPPQALKLAIALNEAVYDLHRNNGWPFMEPPKRRLAEAAKEQEEETGDNWIQPLPGDDDQET
ncbi:MAG: hypothetical protein GEU86_22205 [Actinophytocola sp.]|nr:hypothetical protein [Actinophytocola sp.]